jgi:hypothetical protein
VSPIILNEHSGYVQTGYPEVGDRSIPVSGLPTILPEPYFSLPTDPFLNPDISDAEARLAGTRLHHPGVGSQIRTFARMDAMAYDKTAKSERFSVENLEAGCIILARHAAP